MLQGVKFSQHYSWRFGSSVSYLLATNNSRYFTQFDLLLMYLNYVN